MRSHNVGWKVNVRLSPMLTPNAFFLIHRSIVNKNYISQIPLQPGDHITPFWSMRCKQWNGDELLPSFFPAGVQSVQWLVLPMSKCLGSSLLTLKGS